MDSSSNIYTVLMLVAALALIAAIVYVLVRSAELFGGNPFSVETAGIIQDAMRLIG